VKKFNIQKALTEGAATVVATATVLGTVSPTAACSWDIEFYCAAATGPTNCDLIGIVDPYRPRDSRTIIYDFGVQVYNHANYGERCRLINGAGRAMGAWVYINAGDQNYHLLGYARGNASVDLQCQRRSASGDAGIDGFFTIGNRRAC
jgi:hypothetical protein